MCCFVYQDLSEETITRILKEVEIPKYRPSEKVGYSVDLSDFNLSVSEPSSSLWSMWLSPCQCIETDEAAKKPDHVKMPLSSEEEREAIAQLEQAIATDRVTPGVDILHRSVF